MKKHFLLNKMHLKEIFLVHFSASYVGLCHCHDLLQVSVEPLVQQTFPTNIILNHPKPL